MTKIANPPLVANGSASQYLSMQEFYELMIKKPVNPYQAKFSFAPLAEKLRSKIADVEEEGQQGIKELVKDLEEQLLSFSLDDHRLTQQAEVETIINLIFPSLFFEGQMGFISFPFSKEFVYMTPAMQELFSADNWEVKVPEFFSPSKSNKTVMDGAGYILKQFYGVDLGSTSTEILSVRERESKLEKYFKINIVTDYIKVRALNPPKKLSKKQIHRLLQNWEDVDLWLKQLPPENFVFEGLIVGYFTDVTDVEVLSKMKEMMVKEYQGQDNPEEELSAIRQQICSYLGISNLSFGALQISDKSLYPYLSWSIIGDGDTLDQFSDADFQQGIYGQLFKTQEPVIIGDLQELTRPSLIDQRLMDRGFKSILLAPLFDSAGQQLGVFELGSEEPYRFSKITLYKLRDVIAFFAIGTNKWLHSLNTMINLFIQKQFTAIHPSVSWKFNEIARKHLWAQMFKGQSLPLEPIVFKEVYPLYGQADIVSSSQLRNQTIQEDLTDNLERVEELLVSCRKALQFHLLDVYISAVRNKLARLRRGEYASSDESLIVDLLTVEIHPLLHQLQARFPQLPQDEINAYFKYLDPVLNIVYRKRKAYEDSVTHLNMVISDFIEKEDQKMQAIMPHFFEKFATDGVEYNIYLGESILQNGGCSPFFIRDFRLWQLVNMCEITRLVKEKSEGLAIPLTTAQLIFVYSNTLSISFHMDEKQFDVDGAYNVRYEILKKRIDKALIKGTGERLTVSGKIAIVWLQDRDRLEYLDYLSHLQQEGYLTDEIEEVELDKLQGAEGLKALRVTVIT